jgi:RNA-splicing ligase RtcB
MSEMDKITNRLWNWATDLDLQAQEQALRTSRLPIIAGHVALMPDAHLGIGATIGSVIPTEGAIIPSAVGVDIGCGMAAIRTDLVADDLPDSLDTFLDTMHKVVPAGMGRGHEIAGRNAHDWFDENPPPSQLGEKLAVSARRQFGSLGSGNHFAEVCLDESDTVWLFLHSGSRGVGNQLAQQHMKVARKLAGRLDHALDDLDLAWFVQGTAEFDAYIADMLWSQAYALANRDAMLNAMAKAFFRFVGKGRQRERVNCHHNFAALERHDGKDLWITRKGAIGAADGQLGLIPGSMGTRSYVVRGVGNEASYASCSHGAGRAMSRTAARKKFTARDLAAAMGDRTWQSDHADQLVDEIPAAYKDIDEVMAAQSDLVTIEHTLRQILNYKGT